jgi:hypothetical protein
MIPSFSTNFGSRKLIYALDMPSFQRDFASLKTLDHGTGPNITFTRASQATFFDADGVLQTASNNTPRFDHDPATGASRGLLIEEARTNLLVRSEEFNDGAWSLTSPTSVTANVTATTAPDGSSTADKLVEANNNNAKRIYQNITVATTQNYTISVFAKAAERDRLRLTIREGFNTGTSYVTAAFDLAAGTILSSGAGTTATITSVGNGWYRLTAAGSVVDGATRAPQFLILDQNDSSTYIGDGTSGLYLWGAQLEVGAFPTSYIPTTTAAATRAADSAIVTPVSSFYNPAEGTLYAAFRPRTVTGTRTLIAFDNDTEDEQVRLRNVAADPFLTVNNGGVEQANIDAGTVAAETVYGLTGGFKLNDFAASLNGATVVTDTTGTMPTITHLRIGNSKAGNIYNGAIAKVAYWPKRLTNTLLEQLTT